MDCYGHIDHGVYVVMRTSTLQRKTPLRGTSFLRRSTWKKKAAKRRAGHDAALLKACRGKSCYLKVPGICLGAAGIDTVVPCHANWPEYGKGMGIKADDKYSVPGCMACHHWLDFGPADKEIKKTAWQRAYERWSIER